MGIAGLALSCCLSAGVGVPIGTPASVLRAQHQHNPIVLMLHKAWDCTAFLLQGMKKIKAKHSVKWQRIMRGLGKGFFHHIIYHFST